jgi:hypothetical protein
MLACDDYHVSFPENVSLTNNGRLYLNTVKQLIYEIEREDVEYSTVYDIAGGVLNLDGDERDFLLDVLWTVAFIKFLCLYILNRKEFWPAIFIAMGNSIAYPYQPLIDRLLNSELFMQIIVGLLSSTDTNRDIQTSQITAASTVCKFIQSDKGDIPPQVLPLIPHLLTLASRTGLKRAGADIPSYRSLCAIFAQLKYRQLYPKEFECFLDISRTTRVIPTLFAEFDYGLEGRMVPGTSFYPISYNYALTLQWISSIPELQLLLLDHRIVPLLTKSLSIQFSRSERETPLLWSRSVKTLHNLTKNKQFHSILLQDEMIGILTNVASRPISSFFQQQQNHNSLSPSKPSSSSTSYSPISSSSSSACSMRIRHLAADIVIALGIRWDVQRLFWIAQMKSQQKDCHLQRLPSELIRMILKWLVILGGVNDSKTQELTTVTMGFKF